MSTKKPEGYAPDLFSEHARAAQLGLKVVEILRFEEHEADLTWLAGRVERRIVEAARALGFLAPEVKP